MKRYAPDEIPVDRGQIEDVVELEKRGHRFPKEMRHLDRESHFQKIKEEWNRLPPGISFLLF